MLLNEYARAISENARKISVDTGPLVETMDLLASSMEKIISDFSEPGLGEPLGQILEEIKKQRELLANELPKEMEEVKQSIVNSADEIADSLRETQSIHDKGMEELRRLDEELALRQQQPPEPEFMPPPIEPAAAPEPDFSPGDALLEGLLGLSKLPPPVNQSPRTSGNIWENWQKPGE